MIDGYRLRKGPKPGETWYSHEQMLELLGSSPSQPDTDDGPND